MAGCYHKKQDFKSDINIEVASEGDILQEGQDLDEIKCKKNPGHRDFIPFKDLTLEHLPIEDRNIEKLDMIKTMSSRVVRLVIEKIKNGKRIKEAGSGCVNRLNNTYFISTNNHVLKTDEEVKHCTVEFHYDDDSRSDVLTSRGVKLHSTCPYRDVTFFTFHPIQDFLHQLDLADNKEPDIIIMYKNNEIITMETELCIGLNAAQLQFFQNLNNSLITLMFLKWPKGSISYLKSCYFKFQPIPSNIQQLTSIEMHIDEDDGNTRVIPGDVVKFDDEFVVKISESIFQDKVQKCKLVWNGEVIGRGTRLYLKKIRSSDVSSGIDLEDDIKQGRENYWITEFHPIPRFVEDMVSSTQYETNHMCCISHPHGGIKMVTFGLYLGTTQEQFNIQDRHIVRPGSQCKKVKCLKYSCKTCPGSSGSPVFPLQVATGAGYSQSYSHFMGKSVKPFKLGGELIENINIAWIPLQTISQS